MGGSNQQAQASVNGASSTSTSASSKPGRSTFDPTHPTSHEGINNGNRGSCATSSTSSGCYLTGDQRTALVTLYTGWVNRVASQCDSAFVIIDVDERAKSTDEFPWYASLILTAVVAALTEGLSLAVEAGAGLATAAILGAKAEVNLVASPSLRKVLDGVSARSAVKGVADHGKTAAKVALGNTIGAESDKARTKTLRLHCLSHLRQEMTRWITRMLEEPPGKLDDADLLTLCESVNPSLACHSTEAYEQRFKSALDGFAGSTASKIGRRVAWDDKRQNRQFELETRVAWLITKGAGKRLVYVDRAFSATYQQVRQTFSSLEPSRSSAYDSGTHQLSLQQDASWKSACGTASRHEEPVGPDMMINYVEPELVKVALLMQEQTWLAQPETFMLDYSYAPPRMVKVAGA